MGRTRLVFSGSGGQGVITASVILAEAAALYEDIHAVQSQSYGPEARGGATRSDVIISTEKINFPKVIQPNILVSLTQKAYNKYVSIVRPGGLVITDTRFVKTERKVDARHIELPMYQETVDRIGNPIVFNICMLGAVISLSRVVEIESVMKALQANIPPRFEAINHDAILLGQELAGKTPGSHGQARTAAVQ